MKDQKKGIFENGKLCECIITPEIKKRQQEFDKQIQRQRIEWNINPKSETLVIRIDGWLWRVIAMSGAITEKAKQQKVKVITSRPLVFWWNPYIESVHWLDDRRLFEDVIKWNDYLELEPYTSPRFFNDGVNWLEIAREKLWLDKIADPVLFLAEHEKITNKLPWNQNKILLFQPFGSVVKDEIGADKSYRSLYVKDAQYLANQLIKKWYELFEVIRKWQPEIAGCKIIDTDDLRFVVSLCARYDVLWCDSCLHHASKWFWRQATVIRAWTDRERYWYSTNRNFREFPLVAHTPLRLNMNDFNFDVSNQHTNQFTQEFLDKIIALY